MSKSSPELIRYLQDRICRRLQIDDFEYVEIESKKRVLPEQAKDLKRYLDKKKKIKHEKTNFSFDQFLDTPQMTLFRRGASLRLRYKRGGAKVFLQYKGPGYIEEKVLYRSEFTSAPLKHVMREESRHDIIRFSNTSVRDILRRHVDPAMVRAIKRHVGADAISRLTNGSLICVYQKEKYSVDLGAASLEPSLDRVCAFHINKYGPHSLSTFWEYENEIKAPPRSSAAKLIYLPKLLKFEKNIDEEFDLVPERLDKYHRCASIFLK
jgi:hypothetical protein